MNAAPVCDWTTPADKITELEESSGADEYKTPMWYYATIGAIIASTAWYVAG